MAGSTRGGYSGGSKINANHDVVAPPVLGVGAGPADAGKVPFGAGLFNVAAVSGRTVADLGVTGLGALRVRPRRRSVRPVVRKRIAFQAYSIHLARMFQGAIKRLRAQPGIDIRFVILPHPQFSRSSLVELRRCARTELGLPDDAIQPYWRTLYEELDLLVCADVYARFPWRRTRTCLIAHGAGLTGRFFEPNFLRKTVADFDIVAVNGAYDLDVVRERLSPQSRPQRVAAVGLPCLDGLLTMPRDRDAYRCYYGFEANRPVVVYAPHWQSLNRAGAQGRVGDTVGRLVRAGVSVLIKPHYCSLNPAMSGGVDWRAQFRALTGDPAVAIEFDSDDTYALGHADAMVTDRSSRAFNAMLVGTPVMLLDDGRVSASDPLDATRRNLMRRGAECTGGAAEVADCLASWSGDWRAKSEARLVAEQCLAYPGRSAEVFARLIEEEIGLAPPPDTALDVFDAVAPIHPCKSAGADVVMTDDYP